MLPTTMEAVRALVKADPTIPTEERAQIVAVLRNGCHTGPSSAKAPAQPKHILTRAEVARRFNRSIRFVDYLGKAGILRRITMPGRSRAVGFVAEEVEQLMSGQALPEPS